MQMVIAEILTAAELTAIRARLTDGDAGFSSGKSSAGWQAQAVKDNEQAGSSATAAIVKKVEAALRATPVFMAAARPKLFVKMLVARYRPGMAYGQHVDDPLMAGLRTDLSFTLFLNEPADYDGGDLVISGSAGATSFKLPAGQLILYPSTTLHEVEPVRRGERLVVAGWVRSYIRDHAQREVLFDLDNVIASVRAAAPERTVMDHLLKVRANLIRMWADD